MRHVVKLYNTVYDGWEKSIQFPFFYFNTVVINKTKKQKKKSYLILVAFKNICSNYVFFNEPHPLNCVGTETFAWLDVGRFMYCDCNISIFVQFLNVSNIVLVLSRIWWPCLQQLFFKRTVVQSVGNDSSLTRNEIRFKSLIPVFVFSCILWRRAWYQILTALWSER